VSVDRYFLPTASAFLAFSLQRSRAYGGLNSIRVKAERYYISDHKHLAIRRLIFKSSSNALAYLQTVSVLRRFGLRSAMLFEKVHVAALSPVVMNSGFESS
jgi:hypothetical protein